MKMTNYSLEPEILPEDEINLIKLSDTELRILESRAPMNYVQAFSPSEPDIRSLNSNFQKTTLATVSQRDDLQGYYSPAPQKPVESGKNNLLYYAIIGLVAVVSFKILLTRRN